MAHHRKDSPCLCRGNLGQLERRRNRRNDTHLTVDRVGGIESEHVKDYSDEIANACQGINLHSGMINIRLSDPVKCD